MAIPNKLRKHLDQAGAEYEIVEHRTVYTAYDLAQTLRHDLSRIAKTLLVKTEGGLHLVVLPASKRLNLPKLKKALGVRKLSIASEKDMVKHYNVKPGAIHAFGTVFATPVIVDITVRKAKDLIFPTGNFTNAIRMKAKQYFSLENPMIASFTDTAHLKMTAKSAVERLKSRRKGKSRRAGSARRGRKTVKGAARRTGKTRTKQQKKRTEKKR